MCDHGLKPIIKTYALLHFLAFKLNISAIFFVKEPSFLIASELETLSKFWRQP